MKQVITNEAKTLEQMEAHITELTRQSIIKHIADTINSDLPIDVGSIRKQVADNIKNLLRESDELIKNENQFVPVDTGKLAMNPTIDVFELSETIAGL